MTQSFASRSQPLPTDLEQLEHHLKQSILLLNKLNLYPPTKGDKQFIRSDADRIILLTCDVVTAMTRAVKRGTQNA